MNTELALRTIEALEPYARRLVEKAEQRGSAFEAQWFLALQQARMVLSAFDGDPTQPQVNPIVRTPMCQDLIAVIARITEYPILSSAHTDGAATWFLPCSQVDLQTLQQALRASILTLASTVTAAPVRLGDADAESDADAGEPNR